MKGHYFKYLTAGEEDRQWGLYLKVAGYTSNPPGVQYPMYQHPLEYHFSWENGRVLNEFQVSYITRGKGIFETSEKKESIDQGTIFIVFPGQWHRYRPDKDVGWDEYYIGFKGGIASKICQQPFFKNSSGIHIVGHNLDILKGFQEIIAYVQHENPGHQQLISGSIVKLLGEIYTSAKTRDFKGKEIEGIIRKARFEMRENLDQPINCEELAQKYQLGYSNFRRMFKKYTGVPPAQYHLQQRLQKARDLMRGTDMSIKEIAFSLGFESQFHFSKIFRSKSGVPPSKFRNQNPSREVKDFL